MIRIAIALFLGFYCLIAAGPVPVEEAAQTIEVHAKRFAFEPSEITVKRGETVHLHIVSDDVPHSLVVKGLDIDASVSKSHPADIDFTAKQAGNYTGRCGRFCGSGHGRMTFAVHVTAN
ncbi:MAG TPA: cupredoxin domain-containing protein [Acidobacteriaceae bacterium]|nr:cupredoxin domain-containing protein [Acidobacteriaceae bacterium]